MLLSSLDFAPRCGRRSSVGRLAMQQNHNSESRLSIRYRSAEPDLRISFPTSALLDKSLLTNLGPCAFTKRVFRRVRNRSRRLKAWTKPALGGLRLAWSPT